MLAFRSVVSVLVRFAGRSFSTNSRPALRAAACGGRPRPAATGRLGQVISTATAPPLLNDPMKRFAFGHSEYRS
jgi:hypothetical protein